MRIDYIDPFIESTIQILEETVTKDVTRGDLSLNTTFSPIMGVAVIIGLAGQVSGRFIIDMDLRTALNIASKMNDEELTEFDELVAATLSELANMITGRAVTKLHTLGFKFDLTPPAMLKGDNLTITDSKLEALVVPIEVPQGKIEINVAVKEN